MKKIGYIGVLCIICLISFIQVHNHFSFPADRGFDAADHWAYVSYLKQYHRVPLANEGWELYQPPLYYVLASLLPSIKSIQLINLFAWSIMVTIAWKYTHDHAVTITTACLPIGLYLSHTISNELWSAAIISGYLYWYIKKYPGLVIVGGIAVWSKATAWVAIAAVCVDMLSKRQYKQAIVHGAIILLISLPYYGRNMVVFHSPFATSVDFPQYTIHQLPGYRDVAFFTSLGSFVSLDVYHAHWHELIAGTYFSWYWDGHNVLLPIQTVSFSTKGFILASIPIAAAAMVGLFFLRKDNQNRVLLLYTGLLIASYIAYTIKLPFYSTVKAAFIVSLLPIWGYSLDCARQQVSQHLKTLSSIYLYCWSACILYQFFIRPGWY